jgi:hypothetical protein
MTRLEYYRLTAQIAVLRDVIADGYAHRTIENVLKNLEARRTEGMDKMSLPPK